MRTTHQTRAVFSDFDDAVIHSKESQNPTRPGRQSIVITRDVEMITSHVGIQHMKKGFHLTAGSPLNYLSTPA